MGTFFGLSLPLLARLLFGEPAVACAACLARRGTASSNGRADGLSPQTQSGAETLASFCLVWGRAHQAPRSTTLCPWAPLWDRSRPNNHANLNTLSTFLTSKHRISMEIARVSAPRKRSEQPTATNLQIRRNPGSRHSCRPQRRIRRHVARSLPGNRMEFHPTPSGS